MVTAIFVNNDGITDGVILLKNVKFSHVEITSNKVSVTTIYAKMVWVKSRDKRWRHNLMTSYHYNGNNAKFKIAIGVLVYESINCVSFIFVLNGVVEIFQFNKLLVASF